MLGLAWAVRARTLCNDTFVTIFVISRVSRFLILRVVSAGVSGAERSAEWDHVEKIDAGGGYCVRAIELDIARGSRLLT